MWVIVMDDKQGRSIPILAISMGDPSGIGPEVIVKSLSARDIESRFQALLFADEAVMARAAACCGLERFWSTSSEIPARAELQGCLLVDSRRRSSGSFQPGSRESGEAQIHHLNQAVQALEMGLADGLVTAPVSKKAVSLVLPDFRGHTEYLARRAGVAEDEVTMTFVSQRLAVSLVTTHIPLAKVPGSLTEAKLDRTLRHLFEMIRRVLGKDRPAIGVAGLNPHAGEQGLFGVEETDLLIPWMNRVRSRSPGFSIEGPLPCDSLFRDALAGRFDGVMAMYHDQAMIPLKLGGVGAWTNLTAGLPYVRTSPDHGVAHDIAGTGKADECGMSLALQRAAAVVFRTGPSR